jgi:predicted molibdopterin-dependent oxidoreductase YjgC
VNNSANQCGRGFRYTQPAIIVREPDPAAHLTPQYDQLMSEYHVLSASSLLFDLNGEAKTARTKQSSAKHCALKLGDSFS